MEVALLIIRVIAGLLFAGHGAQKLFGWFGGNGLKGTAGFFEQNLGLSPGRVHAGAAGFNEFAGGLLLAFGLFTPLAAALIIATMTAAIITVHAKNGPWVTDNGWELNALYGVIAFSVARRTREIGVRMAIGANPSDVLSMVMRQGFSIVAIGLVAGGLLAAGAASALSGLLYGISPTDPLTFAGVTLLLASVAGIAALVPARRASRLDPLVALRNL